MSATSRPVNYDVQAIKSACSISSVVESLGIELTGSGEHTYTALCPFHPDRTPSLLVDDRDGHYHCFACKAHGDVIDFVMALRHLSFADACRWLSGFRSSPQLLARTGSHGGAMSLGHRSIAGQDRKLKRWDRLTIAEQTVMNTVQQFYAHQLWKTPAALTYLHQRGMPDEVTRSCGVGYSDGRSLAKLLGTSRLLREAEALGLIRRPRYHNTSSSWVEFLAHRIIVPELRGGHCIWMIGRTLNGPKPHPKYLALPGERPVLGWERAAGESEVFLCEGVFDYLTAVSWDLPAFSPCGTSLPAEQLGFLAGSQVVWGVLDGDEAGHAAAERFGAQVGDRWTPLYLPEGTDLNDLGRRADGKQTFLALLEEIRNGRG